VNRIFGKHFGHITAEVGYFLPSVPAASCPGTDCENVSGTHLSRIESSVYSTAPEAQMRLR